MLIFAGGMATTLGYPGGFTSAQWKELERQAMIYKYMVASVPVPPDLLLPFTHTADSSASHPPCNYFFTVSSSLLLLLLLYSILEISLSILISGYFFFVCLFSSWLSLNLKLIYFPFIVTF